LVGALAACAALGAPGCKREGQPTPPARVAAASDLSFAFTEAGRVFTERTGLAVTFTFGSSGLLSKQLRQGAPFDMFASADVGFVAQVIGAGICDGDTFAIYGRGRIALWSRPPAEGAAPLTLSDLAGPRVRCVAIAHPDHAPYGRAAKQALQAQGLWRDVEPKLVYGENIRQAFQIAQSGNADAAIVALPLVSSDRDNPWHLIDDSLHLPLDQALAVCSGGEARAAGAAFAAFITSEEGLAILRRHGFTTPEAASTPTAPTPSAPPTRAPNAPPAGATP
jgi:molybdate transport system substrate-binding protein